jgi:hypothetical protein
MKQTTVAAVLVLVTVAGVAFVLGAVNLAPPPEYTTKEDENSYFIKQVGMFAVNVYKMAHMYQMYYKYTLQCWSKPAGGGANYYWMVLTATNGTAAVVGEYISTVWGVSGSESKTWKLLSFNCTS